MGGAFDAARREAPEPALDELVDHVVDRHHRYAQGSVPALRDALARAVERWGNRHPPLVAAQALFEELAAALLPHLAKEEHLLFPAIRDLARADRAHLPRPAGPFQTLTHPVDVMETEHTHLRRLTDDLRRETRQFQLPEDADGPTRDCYRQLARFCDDLDAHVDLENEALFPRALALDRRLR